MFKLNALSPWPRRADKKSSRPKHFLDNGFKDVIHSAPRISDEVVTIRSSRDTTALIIPIYIPTHYALVSGG